MISDRLITWIYLFCNLGLAVFLLAVICQSAQAARDVWHFNLKMAFVLLFLMDVEIYREAARLAGWPVSVSEFRVMYVRGMYVLIGFFIREVIYYADRVTAYTVQNRHRL